MTRCGTACRLAGVEIGDVKKLSVFLRDSFARKQNKLNTSWGG